MSYLRLDKVNKWFGRNHVLHDISLEIGQETFCVFLGPSGCGKSTLLNVVAGLESPTDGQIYLGGTDITRLAPHKRNMAMVFQNYALYPHMTVFENIAFGLRVRRMGQREIEDKVKEVSAILNIGDKLEQYPRQLSGGERQRVATGRAIVRDPSLFLFDEPLSNLDARLRLELRKEFLELQQRMRKTSLYVTHDQIEALSLGDVIVVLNAGQIQQVSPPQELYDKPQNLFVAAFIGTPPMNILEMNVRRDQDRIVLEQHGFILPAPTGLAQSLEAREHRIIYLGIRPYAVLLDVPSQVGNYTFEGDIQLAEMLGEDVLVYIRLAEGVEIRAAFKHYEWNKGKGRVSIGFPHERMYFFDAEGKRLKTGS